MAEMRHTTSLSPRRAPTFGPCVRCGRTATQLVFLPENRAVVKHQLEGIVPCPVRPGEMPELTAFRS